MESFPSTPTNNDDEQLPAPPEVIRLDPSEDTEVGPQEEGEQVDLPPAPPEFNPFYPSEEK
jgi:hypothetical protein